MRFVPQEELICAAGYPIETYMVESEDGHITTLHRIPYGKDVMGGRSKRHNVPKFHYGLSPTFQNCENGSAVEGTRRPAILLMHGLLVSSDSWLLQGPGYDLRKSPEKTRKKRFTKGNHEIVMSHV